MDIAGLEDYIKSTIPMAANLGLDFLIWENNRLTVQVPIAGNDNDKGTAFAGSIFSALVLSGWATVKLATEGREVKADIASVDSNIRYRRPLTENFTFCFEIDESSLERAVKSYQSRGKGKVDLETVIYDQNGKEAVIFSSSYVMFQHKR